MPLLFSTLRVQAGFPVLLRQRQFVEDPLCVATHRHLWRADSPPRGYVILFQERRLGRKEVQTSSQSGHSVCLSPLLRDLVLPHLNPSLFGVLLLLSS